MYSFDEINNYDPEIAQAIMQEKGRQNDHIELIASENFVSKAVMAAMGSTLKDIRERDIMADVSMWMLSKLLPLKEQRSYLTVLMLMFSHIQVLRLTWQYFLPLLNQVIQ